MLQHLSCNFEHVFPVLELTRRPVTSGINNTTVVVIAVALFASFTDAVAAELPCE